MARSDPWHCASCGARADIAPRSVEVALVRLALLGDGDFVLGSRGIEREIAPLLEPCACGGRFEPGQGTGPLVRPAFDRACLLPPVLALVSGGADSLCLWGVLRALGYAVEALHVEHGLRGAAGLRDAAHCAGLGATVVPVDVSPGPNVEARARTARYSAARQLARG